MPLKKIPLSSPQIQFPSYGSAFSSPMAKYVKLQLHGAIYRPDSFVLHGAIYRPDSFVLILRYCVNLKAIRYESTSLNRIVADKSHRVIVA